jgi:histidinol-phosphate/aromatic aminotransferase/cobyric acid decarboxylase-like protein
VIPAGRHGGDGLRLARALGVDPGAVLDLSASLNPVAPDPADVVGKHLDALGRYPDPTAATAALAEAMGVERERLLLTNGGAEAIAVVASVVGGGAAAEPEFSLHPRSDVGPRWRSNPNNPTGLLTTEPADVWDEAFYQLATGEWTAGRPGIVVGSLTKLFACPGLRVGYVLADDGEPYERSLALFERSLSEWSLNGLAAEALPDLLATADLPGWRDAVAVLRAQLVELLAPFDPQPSDANYVLCLDAAGLRDRLAPHGVLVRDCTSFGLPNAVRVAVPDERGLHRLEEALCAAG